MAGMGDSLIIQSPTITLTTQQVEKWLKIPCKLSGTNWVQWSDFVMTGLDILRLRRLLTDDPPDPVTEEWSSNDGCVRMMLWNSMEQDILSTVHGFRTTKKLWNHLQTTYSGKASMAHTHAVFQAFARCQQGNRSLAEYYTAQRKVTDELKELFPFSPDPAVHDQQWEQLSTHAWLAGMATQFSTAKPIMLGQSTIPTLSAAFHTLREMFPPETSNPTEIGNSAFVASGQPPKDHGSHGVKRGGQNYVPNSGTRRSNTYCRHCKRKGHTIDECYQLHPHLNPRNQHPLRAQVAISYQDQDASHAHDTPRGRSQIDEIADLRHRLQQLGDPIIENQQIPRATLARHGTGNEEDDWHRL